MKQASKYLFLFIVGGSLYCLLEILFRSKTHWTMGIVGGLCFVLVGLINEIPHFKKIPLLYQMAASAVIITIIEFISGIILNLLLNLHVWDYSNMPFNILGQICLPFTVLWFFISLLAIFLDDWLRYKLFNEQLPQYQWV